MLLPLPLFLQEPRLVSVQRRYIYYSPFQSYEMPSCLSSYTSSLGLSSHVNPAFLRSFLISGSSVAFNFPFFFNLDLAIYFPNESVIISRFGGLPFPAITYISSN